MKFAPVPKMSLSDHVFEQLTAKIVSGALLPGASLPSERTLTETLGVNRGAIREAVKRLSQAGLVASQHGSGNKVLNYRVTAGLDLLPRLLFHKGDVDPNVVRAVMELRSAIAPDAARLCAERSPQIAPKLDAIIAQMQDCASLAELQELAIRYWETIIDGSDNIAYRLAYNSLRNVYDKVREALAEVLAQELRDLDGYKSIAMAVAHGSGFSAHCEAAALVERGLEDITKALTSVNDLGA